MTRIVHNHRQQRASDRGAGAARVGECDRSSSIALAHDQDRSACDGRARLCAQRRVGFRGPDRLARVATFASHLIPIARRFPSCGLSDRRVVSFSRRAPRPEFMRTVMAVRSQTLLNQCEALPAVSGQVHLERLSSAQVVDTRQHRDGRNGTVLFWWGELTNGNGAPQHECG